MNQPNNEPGAGPFVAAADLPRAGGEPVFAQPWQAQAFALAVKLHEQGVYTWGEWTAALAAQLRSAGDAPAPDDGTHYYRCWLAALESLATDKGLTTAGALENRKQQWADAYRHTPHGRPVQLRGGR